MSELWTPGQEAERPRAPLPEAKPYRLAGVGTLTPIGEQSVTAGAQTILLRAWSGPRGLSVLASRDDTPHGPLLHVSVAYADHDPPWATIKAVREALFPLDVDCMMILPRSRDYVNLHEHTFHIFQTPTGWGLR